MSKESTRISSTGALRDTDTGKFAYFGFNHPLVEWVFARYMHRHRKMADGSLRDPDNWCKGFDDPVETLRSLDRHVQDAKLLQTGVAVVDERGKNVTMEEALCGIRFGANALLLDLVKDKKLICRGEPGLTRKEKKSLWRRITRGR